MTMEGQKKAPVLEYTLLAIVTIVVISFFSYFLKDRYIDVSRRAFAGLISGNLSTAKLIDWPEFQAIGQDIGSNYLSLQDEKTRLLYEKAFVKGFAIGFKYSGASFRSFTKWRIYQKDKEKVIVAANYPAKNKVILFTVPAYKKSKITSIQWKE